MNQTVAILFAGILTVFHGLAAINIYYFNIPPEWIHGAWNVWSIKITMVIIYVGVAGFIATLVDIANNIRALREHEDNKLRVRAQQGIDGIDSSNSRIQENISGLRK